jgi:hypothetical protein
LEPNRVLDFSPVALLEITGWDADAYVLFVEELDDGESEHLLPVNGQIHHLTINNWAHGQ